MRREWSTCRKILWFPSMTNAIFKMYHTHIMWRNSNVQAIGLKKLTGLSVDYSCVVHTILCEHWDWFIWMCRVYFIIREKIPIRSSYFKTDDKCICLFAHTWPNHSEIMSSSVFCLLLRPVIPLSSYLINQLIKGDQLSMSFAITFSIFLYKIENLFALTKIALSYTQCEWKCHCSAFFT